MSTMIALHQIVRRDKDGKREVIEPTAVFSASDAEVAYFVGAGAAKVSKAPKAVAAEAAVAPKAVAPKGKKAEAVDSDDSVI